MFWRSTKKSASYMPDAAAAPRKGAMNPSVIASNMNVLGNIVSDGVLDIDGQVDGNVRGHTVTVRPNGRIRGDLMAEVVFVHGRVDGLIKALSVTLYETAQVSGTVMHESLMIEDGAQIDGKLKRMERLTVLSDEREENIVRLPAPSAESAEAAEADEDAQSEKEIRILHNLRLIS
jgi:cytoskeletal protein CcmA (bactofilin family)